MSVSCLHLSSSSLGPRDCFSVFFCCLLHPQSKRNFQPLLPTLLQGTLCPRPARMVPSITHGLILAPLAPSRRKEPAHLPGLGLQPPRGRLPGALPSCQPALGIPAPGICLVCFPDVRGKRGERGKREEGEGPPSLIS